MLISPEDRELKEPYTMPQLKRIGNKSLPYFVGFRPTGPKGKSLPAIRKRHK